MPQIFNDAVMTNDGRALLSREMAGECNIQVTRMAIGSGIYMDSEKTMDTLQKRTALKSEVQSTALSSLKRIDKTSIIVSGVFTNDNVTTAYHINEIGLFAQEKGNESTEVLYSIAVVAEKEGEIMPASEGKNPIRIIHDWIVSVSNSASATIECLPDGAFAMASNVGNVDDLDTKEKNDLVSAVNETLRRLIVTDTSGVLGKKEAEIEAQDLLDRIADMVMNKLLLKTGDSENNTVTFSSSDIDGSEDGDTADHWTDLPKMESGERHRSLFEKLSKMFKNVRYLYKILGSTDLSEMEDGTVTGVLASIKTYCFSDPIDNLLANIKGMPLDARQGPVLQGQIDNLREDVTQINSDLLKNGLLSNLLMSTSINDDFTFSNLINKQAITFFTNWKDKTNFPEIYGSGLLIPSLDNAYKTILYVVSSSISSQFYVCFCKKGVAEWHKITLNSI